MTETLNIVKIDGMWHSISNNPMVRDLFGTDTLPLPHADTASGQLIAADLARRNPNCEILLDGVTQFVATANIS